MTIPIRASLAGANARVTRAREHIHNLIARTCALRDEQQEACSWEWDTDPDHLGEPKLVVSQYVQIPTEMGIVIGEICYNLRSALDYLIFELAILDTGRIVDGTQFPIEDKAKGFAWRKKGGWLNGLNAAHEAAIEALQPYNGCKWAAALRDFSNPDKHRRLVLHRGRFEAAIYANAERLRFLDIPGTITSAIHPVSGEAVHVKLALHLEISFEDGSPVIETLDEIQAHVSATLEAFEPDFQ